MPNRVLFVVEDKKTDHNVSTILKRLLQKLDTDIIVYKYKTTIYDLYKLIQTNPNSTFLSILWARDKKQFPPAIIKPNDAFSSVYLVFDFDPSSHLFSFKKCDFLIHFFNDETRNGKLYFDYPMSESVFDFSSFRQSTFNKRNVSIGNSKSKDYKKSIHENSYIYKIAKTDNFNIMKGSVIKSILKMNLSKYLFLTNEKNSRAAFYSNQKILLLAEKNFYNDSIISVICSSILVIADYNYSLIECLINLPSNKEKWGWKFF